MARIERASSKHFDAIKQIINKTWQFEEMFDNKLALQTALDVFFIPILHQSSYGRVALLDNKVVGAIFGFTKDSKPNYRLQQENISDFIFNLLKLNDNDRQTIYHFEHSLKTAYQQLLASDRCYDSSITLLVVDKEAQGHKIGQQLLNTILTYFDKKQARDSYLFTDTDCNFGFYEHNHFTRRSEREIIFDQTETPLTVFLYDKQLSKNL
jgi:GNAT superfamily N-acetyltransferase